MRSALQRFGPASFDFSSAELQKDYCCKKLRHHRDILQVIRLLAKNQPAGGNIASTCFFSSANKACRKTNPPGGGHEAILANRVNGTFVFVSNYVSRRITKCTGCISGNKISVPPFSSEKALINQDSTDDCLRFADEKSEVYLPSRLRPTNIRTFVSRCCGA